MEWIEKKVQRKKQIDLYTCIERRLPKIGSVLVRCRERERESWHSYVTLSHHLSSHRITSIHNLPMSELIKICDICAVWACWISYYRSEANNRPNALYSRSFTRSPSFWCILFLYRSFFHLMNELNEWKKRRACLMNENWFWVRTLVAVFAGVITLVSLHYNIYLVRRFLL